MAVGVTSQAPLEPATNAPASSDKIVVLPAPSEQTTDTSRGSAGILPPIELSSPSSVNANDDAYPYEFNGIKAWLNLPDNRTSLSRRDLKGKVVLVDFWAYSCINCIRTLPHVTSWDEKYRAKGLVIIGVHSPEFDFEKDQHNVEGALAKYNIQYPVALDNDHLTWSAYANAYWPHTYLFDRDGKLVYNHIGEGNYDEEEAKIRELLGVSAVDSMADTVSDTGGQYTQFGLIGSPEIYLGGGTSRGNIAYPRDLGEHTFVLPEAAVKNMVQLGGTWTIEDDHITAGKNAQLRLRYQAKAIHAVAGHVSGLIENASIVPSIAGTGLNSTVVGMTALYTLADTTYGEHTIELNITQGIELFTFTFG